MRGGLELDPGDPIETRVQEQARIAIADADVIVFVVDAASGMTPGDEEAAELLRRATAPVIVAVQAARTSPSVSRCKTSSGTAGSAIGASASKRNIRAPCRPGSGRTVAETEGARPWATKAPKLS